MRTLSMALVAILLAIGDCVYAQDEAPLPEFATGRLGTLRFRLNMRYGSGMASLAYSHDGATLLGTCDKGLGVWEAVTGKSMDWPVSKDRIIAAAFTSDGKTLVTFGKPAGRPADFRKEKRLIQHWQVGKDKPMREFEIECPRIAGFREGALVTPDGKFVIHAHSEEIIVWKALTGEVHARRKEKFDYPAGFALARDGKSLAVNCRLPRSFDTELLVYDLPDGKQRCRIVKGPHFFPTFSPDGKFLVSSAEKSLRVWNPNNGDLVREIEKVRGTVAFSSDGTQMACADYRGIRLYSVPDFKEVHCFEEAGMPFGLYVYALAFSPDGKRLASGHDQMVAVWDVATGKQSPAPDAHQVGICALAFNSDGTKLASGSDGDGVACVWDLAKRQVLHRLTGHARAAASVAFSSDGKILACGDGSSTYQTGGGDTHIHLWNLEQAKLVRKFPAHLNGVTSLHFALDNNSLASGGIDASVRLWNVADGRRLAEVRGGAGYHWARFSPVGKSLLIADGAGSISLWQPDMKQKFQELHAHNGKRAFVEFAAISKDGKRVVAGISGRDGQSDRLLKWNSDTGKPLPEGAPVKIELNNSNVWAVSPNGRILAMPSKWGSSEIQLWDLDPNTLLASLQSRSSHTTSLAFSPDGNVLASGSLDTTILLWDVIKAAKQGAQPK